MQPAAENRDQRILRLAQAAAALPGAEKEAFLRAECGQDLNLFLEVCLCLRKVEIETESFPLAESFSPGTLLGQRFRIIRRIGMGGMGQVYEALDEKLDRRVAIKCARSGHQRNLPPEARTAREVSHYNVCKVYDLHTENSESGELVFLSMEYIEGETLSARIQRDGAAEPGEALGIVRQLCAGLAQAHQQKVIHGDLKPANVLVTQQGRAVLTDFGLARFAEPDGSHILSQHGGTLDYMAPELFHGQAPTIATDIYALGVLIHTLLTGQTPKRKAALPVPQEAGQLEDPADWRREIAPLPRPWAQVVRKCLEPLPENRYATVGELLADLDGRRNGVKWWAVGAAALLMLAGGIYWQQTMIPTGPLVRLAVLPIVAEGKLQQRFAPVAVDVAERLAGARRNFVVLTPAEAAQNQVKNVESAGSVLGATHALETRLMEAAGQLSVEARLVEVGSGQPLKTLKATYAGEENATLAKALLGTVQVGLKLDPARQPETVRDAAYGPYTSGLTAMRQDPRQVDAAIPFLEQAMRLDSNSALPHAAMAAAYVQKYRNGDGREWLDKAQQLAAKASGISPDAASVLISQGLVEQQLGRYQEAIANYERAATIEPANAMIWRTIAEAYEDTGRDAAAVATYRKAIAAEPNGYQNYFFFGNFHLSQSNWKAAEDMYRQALAIAPGLASAHMNLGLALKQQGKYAEAEQELLLTRKLRPSARLLLNLGALYYEQERFAEALELFSESAKMGPVPAALHRNLGDAMRQLGRQAAARREYQLALQKSEEELTTNPRAPSSRARLALLAARLGDAARARFETSQVLSMEGLTAIARTDAVQTLEILGQREKALEVLQGAPRSLLEEIGRQPDLKSLRSDARFLQLAARP